MTDEIDELVRAAAKAHEGLAGADYFDGFSAKVLARLDRHESFASEVPMMSSDTPPSKDSKAGGDEPPRTGNTDDSGLHDMKALAETAKRRISRRITSQHDAYDESLLSTSTGRLRAVALPAAADLVSLPDLPVATPLGRTRSEGESAATASASEGAAVTPIGAAGERKKSKGVLVLGGVVLAAAAAAVFVVAGGGDKQTKRDEAPALAAKEERAAATGAAPATGAAVAMEAAPAAPPSAVAEGVAQIAAADPQAPEADKAEAGKLREEEKSARVRGADSGSSATPPADKGRKDDAKATAGGGAPGAGPSDKPKKPGAGDKAAGGDKAGGGAPAGGGGGAQDLDDLLNAASGGAQKPTDSGGGDSGGEVKPEKTRLDTKDIKAGMSAVAGKAQSCFDQHGVAGLVKVKATVEPGGSVTKVEAVGEFAGTPTGSCVAGHVKGATFATWTGAPMTISYGFTLQE